MTLRRSISAIISKIKTEAHLLIIFAFLLKRNKNFLKLLFLVLHVRCHQICIQLCDRDVISCCRNHSYQPPKQTKKIKTWLAEQTLTLSSVWSSENRIQKITFAAPNTSVAVWFSRKDFFFFFFFQTTNSIFHYFLGNQTERSGPTVRDSVAGKESKK